MKSIRPLMSTIRHAGAVAMSIYDREFAIAIKDDLSPITEADKAVDAILFQALSELFPKVHIVTEERSASHTDQAFGQQFFLVDPIDGTKEFINKTDEFTINIALIDAGIPIAGIVYAPALGRLFLADINGEAIEIDEAGTEKPIKVRQGVNTSLTAVASRSHNTPETQAFLDKYGITECVSAGSSLKFCVVAAGEADIYPRFGPTMEWDTAAGDAVLRAAGGMVLNVDRTPFAYGKAGYRNPNFIACSPDAAKRCAK
ncbi:MAG: 3'(2'),5'-bisphosphate nucleotidase CysQ [Ahrensia sp.]|nr:3'(2'),5'-bisphosphate nucleotidase CysQ [Ahrensia sp.]